MVDSIEDIKTKVENNCWRPAKEENYNNRNQNQTTFKNLFFGRTANIFLSYQCNKYLQVKDDNDQNWQDNERDCMAENSVGRVKQHHCVQASYEQDRDDKVPGLPEFCKELEGVADPQEALQGNGNGQPPATADHIVKWFQYGQVKVYRKKITSLTQATECSDDVTGIENALKKGSCVEEREAAKETEEAALGLGSRENIDVDHITDDSKNTGGWQEHACKIFNTFSCY